MPSFSSVKRIFKRDKKTDSKVSSVPAIPSVLQPPNDETPSTRPSIAISSTVSLSQDSNDIWGRAYALAKEREEELMGDYERHIASLEGVAVATNGFSDPHDVEVQVKQLLELRQKKKIKVSISGHDIIMREQIEKLAKFLIWSDSIVKEAVSAQPYAALAWSGVSLFLPVSKCKQHPVVMIFVAYSC